MAANIPSNPHVSQSILTGLKIIVDPSCLAKNNQLRQSAHVENTGRQAETMQGTILNHSAPISSLPPEILAEIFKLGRSEKADDGEALQDTLPFELLVTQISSQLRSAAIGMHQLWSTIDIRPSRRLENTATYIARSSGCLLDVRADFSECVQISIGENLEMLNLIIPHSSRWRSFSVEFSHNTPLNSRLHNLSTPLLERLSICVSDVDPNDEGRSSSAVSQLLTGGAPKLTFVRLRGLAMNLFRPPLASVTTLHLDQTKCLPISYNSFLEIVTASPQLTNLSIYGDMIGLEVWPGERSLVELPSLRSLRICGVGGRVYSGLLLGIIAPRLTSLVLKDVQEHDLDQLWTSAGISKFPQLQHLIFYDFELSDMVYKNMFRAFPAIREFTSLYSSTNTPPILKLLADADVSLRKQSSDYMPLECPWPDLQTLTFLLNFEDEPLINHVVELRKTSAHPIRKLRLGTTHELAHLKRYAWLQDNITVERFRDIDEWPDRRNYSDRDDDLFY